MTRKILIALPVILLIVVLDFAAAWGWHIWTDPCFHPWPAVTRCRLCGHRVFAWQRYSRRPYGVRLGNPDGLAVSMISASGLVHDGCEGVPTLDVSVSRDGLNP